MDSKITNSLAEAKKEEGNTLYKEKKYEDALKCYTQAIELCPDNVAYYGNRSACLIMIGRFKQALEDATKCTKLDQNYVKGYIREAKCYLVLGDLQSMQRSVDAVKRLDPTNQDINTDSQNLAQVLSNLEKFESVTAKKDYRAALFYINRALETCTQSVRFKLMKAETLVFLGRHQEAQDLVNDLIRLDPTNADALFIRGMTLYYQDNVDKAFTHFQHALRLSPEHTKAKETYKKAKLLIKMKEEGNAAYINNNLEEAYNIYTSALKIDPLNNLTNAKLYFNRAVVSAKRKNLNEAVEDCTKAIKLDENYIKAYLKRAKLYSDLEMYEEYYYKILGISKNATEADIKKAYRKRAMLHHPDRHSNAPEEVKREQEKKFKELGEAYNVLTDAKKRSRYDNGLDLDGPSYDPNIFNFFNGGSASQGFGGNAFGFTFHSNFGPNQGFNPFQQF
ncbi:dnaJ subfamily C member 7-like protein [Dinothrombium tinctorium]|uniref:DnaJ subfamily C member 7-like protein n=1 Tax=Dinothrombium tinctorium TaxID=1965070 RepID=A0A3S3SKD4_9ACAR|nr:dnaJ subfamily C member 7-like protein [Dinothrombium tinctorium]